MKRKFGERRNKDSTRTNFDIRVPRVRVIFDGKNLGVIPTHEARRMAQDADLDLVEVAPDSNPPVCRIMDYGKFKYEKSKRHKDKGSSAKEKEVSFRYVIDDHDLATKAGQIRKFIEKGFRVKVTVKFKARENAHRDQGFLAISKCMSLVEDIAVAEKPPCLEGKSIIVRLEQRKDKRSTSGQQDHNGAGGDS